VKEIQVENCKNQEKVFFNNAEAEDPVIKF
jgi:hypothetical protein